MTIDRINKLNKIYQKKEVKPVKKSKGDTKTDKIEISDKARELSLRNKYIKLIKESPDIDNSEKIEYLKKQINKPDYITQKIIEDIARKIAESLGIK